MTMMSAQIRLIEPAYHLEKEKRETLDTFVLVTVITGKEWELKPGFGDWKATYLGN
jgi:hypothetical protein